MSGDRLASLRVDAIGADDANGLGIVRRLLREYEAWLTPDLRHADMEAELRDLSGRYAGGAMLTASSGDIAVGCVLLRRRDDATGGVHHLYVVPSARGLGAGRALMESLIARARALGLTRVVLDTHREALGAAYALYRLLGFVECEPCGDVDYACPTYMELLLEAPSSPGNPVITSEG